ncbi:hypothetical protein ACQ4PT_005839 [Festuca glaucescens]
MVAWMAWTAAVGELARARRDMRDAGDVVPAALGGGEDPWQGSVKMTGTGQQPDLEEKSAILCVPNTLTAEEIILSMQKLSGVNLQLDKLENLLLLAKESEVRSDVRQFSLEKILDQYCSVLLFWKHFIRETINALRNYSHQHEYHVNINPKLQFLDFFKRKFSAAYKDVSGCLRFLLRLPQDSFAYVDFEAIIALTIQLEDFHTSLMSEEIEEDALKSVLNVRGATRRSNLHHHGFQLAQELNKKRVGCIVALELLNSSLKLNFFGERATTSKTFLTRADVAKYLMMKSKLMIHIPSSSSFLKNILSSSQKIFDLLIVSDGKCKEETDLSTMPLLKAKNIALAGDDCQLQKYEIDMNKHGHVLFKALCQRDLGLGFPNIC